VEFVLLGDGAPSTGRMRAAVRGHVTIAPSRRGASGAALAQHEVRFMDAPRDRLVTQGGDGTLTIMAGGMPADFERARPLFEAMASWCCTWGKAGRRRDGQLINNAVAAVNSAARRQALLVGSATGVDLDALVRVMEAGSGGSAMLSLKSRPMREQRLTTFKLEHMLQRTCACAWRRPGGRGARSHSPPWRGDPHRRPRTGPRRPRFRGPDRGAEVRPGGALKLPHGR